MVKKKKKGAMSAHQPVIDSSSSAFTSNSNSDSDYIVFESDDSDYSDESDDSSSDDSADESATSQSTDPDPDSRTLVINIKTVRFSNETVTHVVEIEDRKGYWAEDRFRFQQRCTSVRDAISFVFDEMHRRKMRLIVNMSDTLRRSIVPYSSTPFGSFGKQTTPMYSTISLFSNISRGHMTIMYNVPVPVCETTSLALGGFAASGAVHPPTSTWWRS
jgi:hypothetical protein